MLYCKQPVQTDSPGQLFGCILCHYTSYRKSNLLKHLTVHTKEKPFKCNDCNFCAATKSTLVLHVRTHTGEKPYECAICQRKFSRRNIIKAHVKTHTNDKPFKCLECNFVTSRKDNLKFHMRRHLIEKPFKCHICTCSFIQKCRLKRHLDLHTKIFKCFSCCYQTHLEMNLLKHKLSHFKENCFICFLCGKGFGKKYGLCVHVTKVHPRKSFYKNAIDMCKDIKNIDTVLVADNEKAFESKPFLPKTYSDKAIATDDLNTMSLFTQQINTDTLNVTINNTSSFQNCQLFLDTNTSNLKSVPTFNNYDLTSTLNPKPHNLNEILESNLINLELNSNQIASETLDSNLKLATTFNDTLINNTGYLNYNQDFNLSTVNDDSNIGSSSSDSEYVETESARSTYDTNFNIQENFVEQNCVQNVAFVNSDLFLNQQANVNYVVGVNFVQPVIIPTVALQPSLAANSNLVLTPSFNGVQLNQDINFFPVCNNANLLLSNLVPNMVDSNLMLNPTKQVYITEMY